MWHEPFQTCQPQSLHGGVEALLHRVRFVVVGSEEPFAVVECQDWDPLLPVVAPSFSTCLTVYRQPISPVDDGLPLVPGPPHCPSGCAASSLTAT